MRRLLVLFYLNSRWEEKPAAARPGLLVVPRSSIFQMRSGVRSFRVSGGELRVLPARVELGAPRARVIRDRNAALTALTALAARLGTRLPANLGVVMSEV